MNNRREPWTAKQFRRIAPDVDPAVLRPLRDICNAAVRSGLSRKQVIDVISELSRTHPEELSAGEILAALQERIVELDGSGDSK